MPTAPGMIRGRAPVGFQVAEFGEEIGVVGIAPELAVADDLQADALLHLDGGLDGGVLGCDPLSLRNLALGGAAAQVEQGRGAQKAADLVGSEGRGHVSLPSLNRYRWIGTHWPDGAWTAMPLRLISRIRVIVAIA